MMARLRMVQYVLALAACYGGQVLAQDAPKQVDLSAAKVREMIAADRALIAANPKDAGKYVGMAYTLSDVGVGDAARAWAVKATQVVPNAAFVYSAEGWVLRHNAIGQDYGRGYDYDGEMAAYRKAIELDPNDFEIRETYAESLEYNRDGIRYGPGARMDESIAQRRWIKAHQRVVDPNVEDNLLIALFYAGKFTEVRVEMVKGNRPKLDGILVASVAATESSEAAIAAADGFGDPDRKLEALNLAAVGLWSMRLYGLASDMLAAALPGLGKTGPEAKQMQLFRTLKPYSTGLPGRDPRSPVQRVMFAMMSDGLTDAAASEVVTRHAFPSDASWQAFLQSGHEQAERIHATSVQADLPMVVVRDIVMGSMQLMVQPSEQPGFRVSVQMMGSPVHQFFVVQEDGVYKIAAGSGDSAPVGHEALYLVRDGREAEAAALLDWRRAQVLRDPGDDSLGGSLFGRLWEHGDSGTEAIETAAAALTGESVGVDQVARLKARAGKMDPVKDQEDRDSLELLQVAIALHASDGLGARGSTRELLKRYPDSPTAIRLEGEADELLRDWAAWTTLLDSRLEKHPKDRFLLGQRAKEAEFEGDFQRARKALQVAIDGSDAQPEDYNEYAWVSLFSGDVDTQAAEAADKAYGLAKNESFAVLHTLACVDAARGKTGEAREMLLKAMSVGHLAEPNGAIWFGFGLIDEQYGLPEAAIAAYKRVEKPERAGPTDAYVLAQRRLVALAGH